MPNLHQQKSKLDPREKLTNDETRSDPGSLQQISQLLTIKYEWTVKNFLLEMTSNKKERAQTKESEKGPPLVMYSCQKLESKYHQASSRTKYQLTGNKYK